MASPRPVSATHTRTTRGLDQVVDVETPEQVVFSYTIAGIGSRAAAALIDHAIIFGGLFLIILFVMYIIGPALSLGADVRNLTRQAGGWAYAIIVLLVFLVQWGYYVLFEALRDGQTPGKRWLHLRVVQDGGYSISFPASAARNIARIIDLMPPPAYLVGLVTIAVSKSGKRAGDHLAGTIVVREAIATFGPAPTTGAPTSQAQSALTAALSDEELAVLERFLDRLPTLAGTPAQTLAAQLRTRFRAHLDDAEDTITGLSALRAREREARTHGLAARGETGAAREHYALVAEGTERWNNFANRVAQVRRTGLSKMAPEDIAGFVSEYREIATDLARLSTAARGRELNSVFQLSRLVASGHNLLYRQERLALQAMARFLFATVPAELRRSALPILAAAVLLFGSGAVSFLAVMRNPYLVEELVSPGMIDRAEVDAARARAGDRRYIDVEDYERPIVATSVISNNVQVSFFAFASGLTAGIFTVYLLLANGIMLGSVLALFGTRGVLPIITDFVIGHGVFELIAICISAGAGFLIAGAILLPGARTRGEALVLQGRRALRLLTAAATLLLFAGVIEGLISPRTDLSFQFKAGIAGLSGLLVLMYASLGRKASADESLEVTAYK
jgi:uncharacterized membrane protein SpoIIM required for sporulation/uncharacterized RDD family membrane protein YckC